jgi:hypothetical protein
MKSNPFLTSNNLMIGYFTQNVFWEKAEKDEKIIDICTKSGCQLQDT